MGIITSCRICRSKKLVTFFDLGKRPFANSLLTRQSEKEATYPLALVWCHACSLVQLSYAADPKKLFSHYVWVTGTSRTAKEFADKFYSELVQRTSKQRKGYILEIASNDGTFLLPFFRNGYKVLGIDPARNIATIARKNGIPTKAWFFGTKTSERIVKENGLASIVFARNVLPHVANTRDFMDGLSRVVADDGVVAVEVHYAKKILEELHYDSIYHEHLCYFTLKSLEYLLHEFRLFVFDIMPSPISGGSIIVYARKNKINETSAVKAYRRQEVRSGTNLLSRWKQFKIRAHAHRNQLLTIIHRAQKDGGLLVGYGASARSSTLLNFCDVDTTLVPVIIDKNTMKQKRFTAGSRILIEAPEVVMHRKPFHILVLAWNFAEEIMADMKKKFSYQGDFIVPLPYRPKTIKNQK